MISVNGYRFDTSTCSSIHWFRNRLSVAFMVWSMLIPCSRPDNVFTDFSISARDMNGAYLRWSGCMAIAIGTQTKVLYRRPIDIAAMLLDAVLAAYDCVSQKPWSNGIQKIAECYRSSKRGQGFDKKLIIIATKVINKSRYGSQSVNSRD